MEGECTNSSVANLCNKCISSDTRKIPLLKKALSKKISIREDFERLESERKVLEKVLTQERNIAGLKLGVMQKKTDEVIADRAELIAENNDAKQKIAHLLNENDAYFDKIATLELRNEFLHRAMNELKNSIVQ